MGQVYLARSDRGRMVAVKVVREELAAQEEFRARFRQEVRAAQRVGGHWTAPVLDADTEAEVPWVATGYVAGPTLQQVVGRDHGALPERSVRILAAGLAHALQDIHAAGIVHRDLKPSNVLVTIDGPRVIDFGIARALETLAGDGLTRTGSLVGSPGFMAPEQVRGDRITPACDVFCLGSVLAYAATGTLPFGTANSGVHALMFRIAQEEPDLSGVPEGIADLVRDCLRKDPAARPTLHHILDRTGADDTVSGGRSHDPGSPTPSSPNWAATRSSCWTQRTRRRRNSSGWRWRRRGRRHRLRRAQVRSGPVRGCRFGGAGSVRLGSGVPVRGCRFGAARLGGCRSGTGWFGAVRFGGCRSGTGWFGAVRFGRRRSGTAWFGGRRSGGAGVEGVGSERSGSGTAAPGQLSPEGQAPGTRSPGGQDLDGQDPGVQIPGVQNPAVQIPGTQNPGAQNLGMHNPSVQDPGVQDLGVQNPAVQIPGVQNPAVQIPAVQNPGAQNLGMHNPSVQDPGVQDLGTQNPAAQSPGTQNPAVQNPGTQNPTVQNPAVQNPGAENPVAQNPVLRSPEAQGGAAIEGSVPAGPPVAPATPVALEKPEAFLRETPATSPSSEASPNTPPPPTTPPRRPPRRTITSPRRSPARRERPAPRTRPPRTRPTATRSSTPAGRLQPPPPPTAYGYPEQQPPPVNWSAGAGRCRTTPTRTTTTSASAPPRPTALARAASPRGRPATGGRPRCSSWSR